MTRAKDTDFPRRTIYIWTGVLLVQILFWQLWSVSDSGIQALHKVWQAQRNGHILLFSGFDFNVGDALYLLLILWVICQVAFTFRPNSRRKALARLLKGLNLGYLLYFIFWGNLYSTPPLTEKMSPLPPDNQEKMMVELLEQKISEATVTRRQLGSELEKWSEAAIVARAASAIQKNSGEVRFAPNRPLPKDLSVKNGLTGKWQAYTGISGYYNPFTAEATVNFAQPKTALAFTSAHEMAHQMGFARESEASFIGYLMALRSEDALVRYGADRYAIELLLHNLYLRDRPLAKKLKASLPPEIQQDMALEKSFYLSHSGWLSDFFGWANDLFLKSNRQRGSLSYNDALSLILQFHHDQNKGRISRHGPKNTNDEKNLLPLKQCY